MTRGTVTQKASSVVVEMPTEEIWMQVNDPKLADDPNVAGGIFLHTVQALWLREAVLIPRNLEFSGKAIRFAVEDGREVIVGRTVGSDLSLVELMQWTRDHFKVPDWASVPEE